MTKKSRGRIERDLQKAYQKLMEAVSKVEQLQQASGVHFIEDYVQLNKDKNSTQPPELPKEGEEPK